MPAWLDDALLRVVDTLYALPRHAPTPAQLAACRIVSHRGERSGRAGLENTYAAFDPLRNSGVFGLEFDVRWTADLVPVVFHDTHFARLFGDPGRLCDTDAATLARRYPQVPTLHEFVRRYCGEFHLMPELKAEPYPDPALQDRRLAEALAPALELDRVHLLTLQPSMLAQLPSVPASRTLGVGRLNAAGISREALAAGRAGFACHYALLRGRQVAAHHAAGQRVGCGFPSSSALLCREAARGVDWVFTNRALELERWRQQVLRSMRAPGTPSRRG